MNGTIVPIGSGKEMEELPTIKKATPIKSGLSISSKICFVYDLYSGVEVVFSTSAAGLGDIEPSLSIS